MSDLTTFLSGRLDDEEHYANAAIHAGLGVDVAGNKVTSRVPAIQDHFATWNPARVLREVAAKRAVLDSYNESAGALAWLKERQHQRPIGETDIPDTERELDILLPVLKSLAAVYRDHPDYDPAWKVEW